LLDVFVNLLIFCKVPEWCSAMKVVEGVIISTSTLVLASNASSLASVLTTNSSEDNCDNFGEIRSMLSRNNAKSDTLRVVAIARICYILVKDALNK